MTFNADIITTLASTTKPITTITTKALSLKSKCPVSVLLSCTHYCYRDENDHIILSYRRVDKTTDEWYDTTTFDIEEERLRRALKAAQNEDNAATEELNDEYIRQIYLSDDTTI